MRILFDEHGDRYRAYKENDLFIIEIIAPAFTPNAGKVDKLTFLNEITMNAVIDQAASYYNLDEYWE